MEEQQNVPKRKKHFYQRWWFWVIVALVVCAMAFGGNEDPADPQGSTPPNSSSAGAENDPPETTEAVSYTPVTAGDMVTLLEENALRAKQTYQDQYVEITGKLAVIDSSGDYISLDPLDQDFNLTNIQCFLQDEQQVAQIANLSKGDTVTLRGQVTDVGEILGYSVKVHEILPGQSQ